ncbi:phospholipase B-like 1 [Glandiceps talaboti]
MIAYVLLVIAIAASGVSASFSEGSISMIHGKAELKWSLDKSATAYGTYNDTLESTGWGVLNIKAGYEDQKVSDNEAMYAAGYLEGALTAKRIYQHYLNMYAVFFGGEKQSLETKVRNFFDEQEKWVKEEIRKNPECRFWRSISVILSQMDGLVDGYIDNPYQNKTLDRFAFQVLNGVGDMLDLRNALEPEKRPDWKKMTDIEFQNYFTKNGLCSALIKVLGAYENIYMSHSSWFEYSATSRIYKHYNFNLPSVDTASKLTSFSSYPGFLESLDDYYLMDNGLVMIQTSNNVFNSSLYETVVPQSVLAWLRVRAANMLAHNGKEWADVIATHNSGTYNNQYMILNLNLIQLNKTIQDNALWVVEQIPTLVEAGDQTPILRAGYWPSYNVPFFENVYNLSGYPEAVQKFGQDYSYQLAPRAKIFRRDQGKVKSFQDMKHIMRYNDYLHDEYSEMDSCKTICCRGDLMNKPQADGCYDTKLSDYHMARKLQSLAINGPSLGTGLPPFKWTAEFHDVHVGLPQVYDFSFVPMEPQL